MDTLFGVELAELISNISIEEEHQHDIPELIKAPMGTTLTSILYKICFAEISDWPYTMQNLKLPPRKKLFWWRLINDSLQNNTWLARRGLTHTTLCPWGCNQDETPEHIAVQCSITNNIIQILATWGCSIPIFSNLQDLLQALTKVRSDNLCWARMYCAIVYQVWRSRTAKTQGRSHGTPKIIAASILSSITHSTSFPFQKQWDITQPFGLIKPTLWCPPPPGWIKANMDGSLLSNGSAGIAVVSRDESGNFIKAMGHCFQHWDSTSVELAAMLYTCRIIEPWMTEYKGIIIEGDNIGVVDHLKHSLNNEIWQNQLPDAPDISFLKNFHQVLFVYTNRSNNTLADFCADIATSFDFVWHSLDNHTIPPQFFALLE